MTADIELLPLPELASERVFGAKWDDFDIQDYARANVAHATAEKDAEIERLRDQVGVAAQMCWQQSQFREQAQARAERLAEALREARQTIRDLLPDATFTKWDALLRDHDQEVGNG